MKRACSSIAIAMIVSMVLGSSPAGAGTEHIRIVDQTFRPKVFRGLTTNPLNPAKGTVLVWQNRDDVAHRVHEDPDQAEIRLRTALIPAGEDSDGRRIKFAGTWKYICSVHPATMAASIRVRPALYERGDPGNYAVTMGTNGVAVIRLANASVPSLYRFVIQRKKDDGAWVTVHEGLRAQKLEVSPNGPGDYRYRVRIRHQSGTMTGWSPVSKKLTIT